MTVLLLLIVGVVLLIVGYMVPMPPPLALIVRIAGAICLAIGLVLLLWMLLGGGAVTIPHALALLR